MRRVRISRHDEGWLVNRFTWADPGPMNLLAHDILEHSPSDTGTYEQEITAFGRMLVYRFNTPYLYGNKTKEQKINYIAQEIYSIVDKSFNQSMFSPLPKRKPKKQTHELIKNIANEVKDLFEQDFEHINIVQEYVYHWLLVGYKKASKLFNHETFSPDDIYTTLLEILKLIDKSVHNEVILEIDYKRCWIDYRPVVY